MIHTTRKGAVAAGICEKADGTHGILYVYRIMQIRIADGKEETREGFAAAFEGETEYLRMDQDLKALNSLLERYFLCRGRDFENPNPETLRTIQRGA